MALCSGVLLALSAVWGLAWVGYYNILCATRSALDPSLIRPLGYKGNILVLVVYAIILFLFTLFYGGYRIGQAKRGDVLFSGVLAMMLCNGITFLQTCLMARALLSPVPFFAMTLLDGLLIWAWTSGSSRLCLTLFPPRRMLVVYGKRESTRALIYKMIDHSEKYQICEAVHAGDMDLVLRRVNEYEAVLLCDVDAGERSDLIKYCFDRSIPIYLAPHISDTIVRGAESVHLFDTPLLLCPNIGLSAEQRAFKRAFDLCLSSFALLLSSPVMLLTAVAIKLCDGGPVLFRQQRCTRDGHVFEIYKFRSMVVDAEADGVARLAAKSDDRITPVGRFIRRLRLDELPQLLNVFQGEMSLVGPRPERPEIAAEYEREMPEFRFRLKVKAGITGYAQVLGKYNTTPYDKLKLDMMYITQYSILLDLKLVLMTLKILFQGESTEGISKDAVTALREDEQPVKLK